MGLEFLMEIVSFEVGYFSIEWNENVVNTVDFGHLLALNGNNPLQ